MTKGFPPKTPTPRSPAPQAFCSFCAKPYKKTGPLITGKNKGVAICGDCLVRGLTNLQDHLYQEDRLEDSTIVKKKVLYPRDISSYLDQYIIGQDKAKISLSVAVYNHYQRINNVSKDVELDKSNVLLMGPTGSGKTLLAKTLARILDVPFAIGDATTVTEAGYVGEDVENLILKLVQNADYNIELAQKGIIYIDEIDKIGCKNQNVSITRDVSGEGVQQALLKLLEGTVANIPPLGGRKHPEQQYIPIDTSNILFICGGTFVGLDKIVKRRVGQSGLGFNKIKNINSDDNSFNELIAQVTEDDLREFGLIPELIGRLPVKVGLELLDEASLMKILTEPRNCLVNQFKKYFEFEGASLEFDNAALAIIAKKAIERKTGARALRSVLEDFMTPILYELPHRTKKKYIVTEDVFLHNVPFFDDPLDQAAA